MHYQKSSLSVLLLKVMEKTRIDSKFKSHFTLFSSLTSRNVVRTQTNCGMEGLISHCYLLQSSFVCDCHWIYSIGFYGVTCNEFKSAFTVQDIAYRLM